MSREIKFQAYVNNRLHGKGIFPVVQISFFPFSCRLNIDGEYVDFFDFDNIKLREYTGLKDKNGREIYEGDIAEVTYMGFIRFRVQIVFGEYEQDGSGGEYSPDKCIGFYAKALGPDTLGDDGCRIVPDYLKTTSILSFESVEVIGNIYENPELLEVKNDELF